MARWIWCVLSIHLCSQLSESHKILVVFPMPAKSHSILGDGIVNLLLDAGHEITYITPFPQNQKHSNVKPIDVSANFDHILNGDIDISIDAIINKRTDFDNPDAIMQIMIAIPNTTLANTDVQKLLNDPNNQFDLVIAEWMFTDVFAGLHAVFDCPFIWSSSLEPHWMILELIDETLNPSYNPNGQSSYLPPFNFHQRLSELWNQIMFKAIKFWSLTSIEQKMYDTYIAPAITRRGKSVPDYLDLRYNASLVLGNSHVSLGQATRLPQNYKAIGGYHVDRKAKPLPEDLKKVMDNSKEGVIYFSMGSNLKSASMPKELKQDLIKMFGELKQTVLWKFEEVFPNLPKNVHILKWAPQQSILEHPNCVLFITHGGLLSSTETIHAGKPIIGIPVFGDQFLNINRAVAKGYGKRVDLSYTMADKLKEAIEDILKDPSYTQKVKELSLVYHDRPVSPQKEVVHWVEHVVRTRGAPHLRSPALHMPWYQKLYFDLLALILVIVLLVRIILKKLSSLLFKSNKVDLKKKKK